ncbi:hypothetical protein PBRA_001348, partial [Plasmodiophora brassicae]
RRRHGRRRPGAGCRRHRGRPRPAVQGSAQDARRARRADPTGARPAATGVQHPRGPASQAGQGGRARQQIGGAVSRPWLNCAAVTSVHRVVSFQGANPCAEYCSGDVCTYTYAGSTRLCCAACACCMPWNACCCPSSSGSRPAHSATVPAAGVACVWSSMDRSAGVSWRWHWLVVGTLVVFSMMLLVDMVSNASPRSRQVTIVSVKANSSGGTVDVNVSTVTVEEKADYSEWMGVVGRPADTLSVCGLTGGGFGSAMQPRIVHLIMTMATGLTYVHRPVPNTIEWGTNPTLADRFLNLGEGEIQEADLPPGTPTTEYTEGTHFVDINPNLIDVSREALRNKYFSPNASPKPVIVELDPVAINVALHIRKGYRAEGDAFRFIANNLNAEKIRALFTAIRQRTSMPVKLNIYSSGGAHEFPEFTEFSPTFVLDGDALYSLHAMVTADILVMAHSSFSYVAAMYNDGFVLYDPFWHQAPSSWMTCTNSVFNLTSAHHVASLRRVIKRAIHRANSHYAV